MGKRLYKKWSLVKLISSFFSTSIAGMLVTGWQDAVVSPVHFTNYRDDSKITLLVYIRMHHDTGVYTEGL